MSIGPIGLRLPPKVGQITLIRLGDGFKLKGTPALQCNELQLSDNQAAILRKINISSDGLIAAEIAREMRMTHAGVLFLLKPLLDAGFIMRVPLPGGGVIYYSPFEIKTELSPVLEQAKEELERRSGKSICTMSVQEFYEGTENLRPEIKNALRNWALEGGWKR